MKIAFLDNKRNLTKTNRQKRKKAQREVEYIKAKLIKLENSVEDKQPQLAVNKVEWKKKHLVSKTESCLPRRETSKMERTFQE